MKNVDFVYLKLTVLTPFFGHVASRKWPPLRCDVMQSRCWEPELTRT